MPPVKYREIIADRLHAAGWTWGYCSAVTRDGWRWIVDALRDDGRRYIVQSDELLSAFLELEQVTINRIHSKPTDCRFAQNYAVLVSEFVRKALARAR
jgi:hypothetical protein